ncbi:tripartite motif-containing protein 16 [Conger conger]|uniref:tripartite motif-containing protein 16 n=1 Tax=Conger conger TaxID=82655 RepID=UPI002A59F994|nr:tripartite motif-containing protein 16 [Conger conger]
MPEPKKAGTKAKAGAKGKAAEKVPAYEANIPEPTTRAELLKHWLPLTLDDRTAQKMLWISEGSTKVTRKEDESACPYPNRPERFDHSPQVLCKEGLLGIRGYWEVESSGWVVIGVMYESVGRKAQDGATGLGENEVSWGVGWAGTCYHVWHNSENVEVQAPLTPVIGVYLDQPAGVVSFFAVQGEEGQKEAKLLHRYKVSFKERLLPGFWVGTNSYCWIQKRAE